MSKYRWYWALVLTLFVAFFGAASGCTITSSLQEPAPQSALPADETDITASSTAGASAPGDYSLVGSDPTSGQSQETDLSWEQLCLSSQYQVQIAKDPNFTMIVIDTGAFTPADSTSPSAYYPAGGRASGYEGSAMGLWGNLESGHTYYWRARALQAATGQYMRSPWSEVKSFTVKPGMPANAPTYGPQAVYPNNAGIGCPVKPVSFSWSPLQDTTKYKFCLAEDAAMIQVIIEAEVPTTAYEYNGTLEYGTSYFWRVMALEPAPSDWSATFSFQTEAAPQPQPELLELQPETPFWAWVVIGIGAIMLIVIIVLIFKARRR